MSEIHGESEAGRYNLKVLSFSAAGGGNCGLYSEWTCVHLKTGGSGSTEDPDVDKQQQSLSHQPMPKCT